MTSPKILDSALLVEVLQAAAPAHVIEQIAQRHGVKTRRGIYSLVVVVWLMIYQRLNSKRTLSSAVQFLAKQAALWRDQPHVCKRIREGRISVHTGGYSQARRKMPTLVGCSVCDLSFTELEARMRQRMPEIPQPIFVVDGTTLQLPHHRELLKAYPPGSNQHGKNHWAIMLLVAFHDVHTGLAWISHQRNPHMSGGAKSVEKEAHVRFRRRRSGPTQAQDCLSNRRRASSRVNPDSRHTRLRGHSMASCGWDEMAPGADTTLRRSPPQAGRVHE
jgi:hypothetical protein